MDERVRPAPSPATTDPDDLQLGVPPEPPSPPPSRPPIDPSDPSAPAFDAAGDPLPARTFAPGIDDAALGFSSTVREPPGCQWCGAPLPEPDLATCPSCGAALKPVAELPDIPGLTVAPADVRRTVRDVSPEIRALVAPPVSDEIARPGARPELGPPDRTVRRAMLELELEARGSRPGDPEPPEGGAAEARANPDGEAAEPRATPDGEAAEPGVAPAGGVPDQPTGAQ